MEIKCPHCSQTLWIDQINCGIFRCGVYKQTFEQIPPHLIETECNQIREEGLVYGCAKPFRYDGITVSICDYI